MVFPLTFLFLLTTFFQQIDEYMFILSVGFTQLVVMVLLYMIMVSNIFFAREKRLSCIRDSLKGLNLKYFLIPVVIMICILMILNQLWLAISELLGIDNLYYPGLGLITLLVTAWFRAYLNQIIVRFYRKVKIR